MAAADLGDHATGEPREIAAQLKSWFTRQPAARPPASEHLSHGARENQQLAEIIGQLQHLIQLAEYAIGRPALPPVTFSLASPGASVTVDPPMAPCTLVAALISMDGANALGVTVSILAPSLPGGSRVIGSGKLNENAALPLALDAYVPPDCSGIVITPSNTAANWAGTLTFRPVIPGGYPYVR